MQSKFKRLKRGHREDNYSHEPRGVEEIFSDDEEDLGDDVVERRQTARDNRGQQDEFADFIEDDEFEDDIQRELEDEREVARPGAKGYGGIDAIRESGLDEAELEDMRAAFGDGTEYDWALAKQQDADEEQQGIDKPIELKDVFEPSQLKDKMLTDEDEEIRIKDIPERFQLARKPFKDIELSEDDAATRRNDEAKWITNLILPKKRMHQYYYEPFLQSVRKVLEFMNVEDYEVPFIFQHRKDYLIHAGVEKDADQDDPDEPPPGSGPERLLASNDLWDIFELDMKFRAMMEKKDALQKTYDNLRSVSQLEDRVVGDMLDGAVTTEEVQDIQEYLHFQYSAELRDMTVMESETNGAQRRAGNSRAGVFENVRSSRVYNMVRSFGITADNVAQNALDKAGGTRRHFTDDPNDRPDDMSDSLVDLQWSTSDQILRAAKHMYAEELFMSPRMRKVLRQQYYATGLIDCFRTEKGAKKITEDHPYYEFKYLRGQDIPAIARRPELFLRMLKAEDDGLVQIKLRLDGYEKFRKQLYSYIESDNFSEVADAWNVLRREVIDMALLKLDKTMSKSVKETLKAECESTVAKSCRDKYSEKLDQAPYKPKGMALGSVPRVLTLSNGKGSANRDAICWAWVEDDGRVLENGKFTDLRLGNAEKYLPDGKDVAAFVELVQRRKPDVIGVSGFSTETRRLYKDLQDLVDKHDLRGNEYENEDGADTTDKLEVVLVNDEVARLYQNSDRSNVDHPGLPAITKYCIALARYLQSPLKEYAALGKDITSISFDPNQSLISQEKLLKSLDNAMVDMVNLVGVDVADAVSDPYTANLLPYVCGLGPRKANQLLKVINLNGGVLSTRFELLGDRERKILPAVGPKIFSNCASFLAVDFDSTEPESDYLDSTRVHPEDYDLGRKMAADALEMDEEDIKAEVDEYGPAAVVRRLVREDKQEAVNDLVLEEYAEQLETKFNQRKRATLETIRAELQSPFEELRRNFALLSSEELFTMLTGETRESLAEGMIVPVQIRRTFPDHIEVKLDCGIEGGVSETEYPEGVGGERGVEPRQVYSIHQTVQAKIMFINRKQLSAQLSFREDALRRPYRRELDHLPGEWDDAQEAEDREAAQKEKDGASGRSQRVVNHPLFFNFSSAQAEEYLGSKEPGAVVIRASSKGPDHLAVTWKVADGIYQHLDVLELDKENEFSLGRTLKVGKYSYSDLDELIVNHVEAMSKKVTEMTKDERFQKGSRASTGKCARIYARDQVLIDPCTEQWLKTYTEANPKRSMYAFCIEPKYPGYFNLCFKAGLNAQLGTWPVKIIPNAFELQRNAYPDMTALKNGFKTIFGKQISMRIGGRL